MRAIVTALLVPVDLVTLALLGLRSKLYRRMQFLFVKTVADQLEQASNSRLPRKSKFSKNYRSAENFLEGLENGYNIKT